MLEKYGNYIQLYIENYLKSTECRILLKETIDNKYYISFRTDEGVSYIYDANDLIHPLIINPTTICEKDYEHISFFQSKEIASLELKNIIRLKSTLMNKLYKANTKSINNIVNKLKNEKDIMLSICDLFANDKVDEVIKDSMLCANFDYFD